jgi:hypothetical protein
MMIVSKQNLRALTKEMFLNLMNEKGLAALEIIRNFNKKEREKMTRPIIKLLKVSKIFEDFIDQHNLIEGSDRGTMLSENPERDIVINFKNNAYLLTIKQTEVE